MVGDKEKKTAAGVAEYAKAAALRATKARKKREWTVQTRCISVQVLKSEYASDKLHANETERLGREHQVDGLFRR